MKKVITIFILTLIVNNVLAQKDDISMSGILSDASKVVNLVEREYGQEIVRMEFDIVYSDKLTYRTLSDQYKYGIIAFGDYRINDIDVKVYKWVNEQWVLIVEDKDNSKVASVEITPSNTGEYKIVITAYKFEPGYNVGHYGLIVYHP